MHKISDKKMAMFVIYVKDAVFAVELRTIQEYRKLGSGLAKTGRSGRHCQVNRKQNWFKSVFVKNYVNVFEVYWLSSVENPKIII